MARDLLVKLMTIPLEALIWGGALVALLFADPHSTHISLCPLALTGMDWCPGCGLGHAVSFALQGNIGASVEAHPLGLFAIIILSSRIFRLIRNHMHNYGKNN
ncbi:MAG TPA: DUF2752 domain-containing protein [Chryseosolibacter sp.]|nr:DUF2752 domain-containing protein [Chryseosolibacter sp.]